MTERTIPRALVLTGIILDVLIVLVLSVRRKSWQLWLYTALAIVVLGWFWHVTTGYWPLVVIRNQELRPVRRRAAC